MTQEELNNQLYKLLIQIKDSSKTLIDNQISEDEANKYKCLNEQNLVANLQVEYYYSGPIINAKNAIITEDGYDFIRKIEELKKPIRMNRKNSYEQLQIFLQRVVDEDEDLECPNKRVKKSDYYDLITNAIEQNLVKDIGIYYADDEPHLAIMGEARVTTNGYSILDTPYIGLKSAQTTEQNFNFYGGDYNHSTFGSHNTQNNN
ncbi:hypothetical protein JZB01_002765 [Listeria monocytogenes]|nr:hypothetical protein [Listeria monocytogenes]EHD0417801.1 hypothetical protein [Listeria monocytogenes]